jgi:TatD DNase family protein
MIDTHCHLDLYPDPMLVARECEDAGIITIGMTNLPSHFELGAKHLVNFKKVRLALGLHPLRAEAHPKEFDIFVRNVHNTSYIGEVGLDFSAEGSSSKSIQLEYFEKVLYEIKDKKKIVSLHSRKAEKEVTQLLSKYKIKNTIFHWYTGPLHLIESIIEAGSFFSINPAMIRSIKGRKVIERIPINRILTESDGPFVTVKGNIIKPSDIASVLQYLANSRQISYNEVERLISRNFFELVKSIV